VNVSAAGARTRGSFLKLAAAGAVTAAAASSGAQATPQLSAAQDERILQFALLLEQLKAAFYSDAVSQGRLTGQLAEFAKVVAAHERDHVAVLTHALGGRAKAAPRFRFGQETRDARAFTKAAIALEEAAVGTYNGQAANLRRPALALALKIVSVEGRHAAWIRAIAGSEPAPRASDPGEASAAVLRTLRKIGHG
jgi:rubrerythrin